MTINSTQTKLLHYFSQCDVFGLLENFREVFPDSANVDCDMRVARLALEKLVEIGVVANLDTGDHWVLTKPLASYSQTVKLTGETATAVGKLAHLAKQKARQDVEASNLLRITENDIQTLCLISAAALGLDAAEEGEDVAEQPKLIGFEP